jgi:hypothetical protein
LQPGDWTNYSAMGVAYDQLSDQKNAQNAYEHALALKPEEPSVLSNYALSRLLANDPDMARKLAARAERAGGANDPKIARNVAMIHSLAPEAPAPVAVAAQPQAPVVHAPVAPAPQVAKAVPPTSAQLPHDNRVVMQRVPVDPLAGPVAAAKPVPVNTATQTATQAATQAPRPLQPQLAAEETHAVPAPKPVASQPLPPPVATVKAAEAAKPAIPAATAKLTPAAPVKTAETFKPATVVKPAAPVKAAEAASASVTLRLAPPLKGETDKPAQPPKVLPPTPVKAAAKDAVPGLRVSTNAY